MVVWMYFLVREGSLLPFSLLVHKQMPKHYPELSFMGFSALHPSPTAILTVLLFFQSPRSMKLLCICANLLLLCFSAAFLALKLLKAYQIPIAPLTHFLPKHILLSQLPSSPLSAHKCQKKALIVMSH